MSQRVDTGTSSTATQRFDLEGDRVVPQIAMHDDQASFHAAIGRNSTIRANLRPHGARYEIHTRRVDGQERVCTGEVSRPVSIACPFASGSGTVEIVARGDLTWSDLRVERSLRSRRNSRSRASSHAPVFCGSVPATALRIGDDLAIDATRQASVGRPLMVLVSTGVTTATLEGVLRVLGTRLSAPLSAARHDLGELTADPRWQRSPRFGQRLAANFDGTNLWRYGDIIRMGFLSSSLAENLPHLYPLHTDAEGFRNASVRDRIDVAALGDSFTDALTLPVEQGWPMQLEQRLGLAVQNYGTAGFGPQQELFALRTTPQPPAPRRRPRLFAGNDVRTRKCSTPPAARCRRRPSSARLADQRHRQPGGHLVPGECGSGRISHRGEFFAF